MLELYSAAGDPNVQSAAVFVHGIFGSPSSWGKLLDFLRNDSVIRRCYHLVHFCYDSPRICWNPLQRIPQLSDVADALRTGLSAFEPTSRCERVVLIGHSQGGLVIQRYIADALRSGHAAELHAIKAVVQFATPNIGSQLLLSVRRGLGRLGLWHHPQERTLRPFDQEIEESRRIILRQVLYASHVTRSTIPIPFHVYAGESDGIVPAPSARWVFPESGTIPGNHFSIVKPKSEQDEVCRILVRVLRRALQVVESDRISIGTQALDPDSAEELDAIMRLQGEAFPPNARMRRQDLSHWLQTYESSWGIRLSVIAARIDEEIVGFLMFHEARELIVIDYVAITRPNSAAPPHSWPECEIRSFLLPRLLRRLYERAERLGVPVVFEVEDPRAVEDQKRRREAKAKIRLFSRYDARIIEGVSFLSPDMDQVPLSQRESRYLLMFARPGRADLHLPHDHVDAIVRFLYLEWYRNWFAASHDRSQLEGYLQRLYQQVRARIPETCQLIASLDRLGDV